MKPIFFIGEAMGENEVRINRGFVGATGAELLRMLSEANVISLSPLDSAHLRSFWATRDPWSLDKIWENHREEVFRTNVFQLHPPGNKLEFFCGPKPTALPGYAKLLKAGYVRSEFAPELARLGDEILSHDPNLIVCLGNTAIWAMLGTTGVTKLRGTTAVSTHCVSGYKLLCTYHPSAVHRQWELRPTVISDLGKINEERDTAHVERPRVEIWTEPTLEDIQTFFTTHVRSSPLNSVDIETSGTRITCTGFAPRPDLAIVIPFDDERAENGSYWATPQLERQCWKLVREVLEDSSIPKLFQNGLYDIAFLLRSYGIGVRGATQDTMLLHHALQPESLKSLGFLGSIYTNHGPWKSERKGQGSGTIKRDA
jgi:uracil-DNA glycosylase